MLALAAETKPMPAAVPAMIRFVAAARAKASYTSTQDEAWMLLAARAIKEGNQSISLNINGSPHVGPYATRVTGDELLNQPITVSNPSPDTLEAVVTTVAAPVQPLPAGGNGFQITYLQSPRRSRSSTVVSPIAQSKASIAVWSPGLDTSGNSHLGRVALEMLTKRMGWSVFGV
jgi:uncharacterized protein YfaS (alpha-2-macroglobulin family)